MEEKGGLIAGLVQKTISGNWVQQPLIKISRTAADAIIRFGAEFGLTPSARVRLAIFPGRKTKSKFDGLISLPGGKK